jgi:GT2 family glycosyltransferase
METSSLTVVAVVVTRNPGPSFEDTLASLAAQDIGSLPILVLDDGSLEPVTNRVAQIVPSAFVRRFDRPIGFAAAANESLAMVQGAEYLLFYHDDVALAAGPTRRWSRRRSSRGTPTTACCRSAPTSTGSAQR